MTPLALENLIHDLGTDQSKLARATRQSVTTVWRHVHGKQSIKPTTEILYRLLAERPEIFKVLEQIKD